MSKRCEVTGAKPSFGNAVSHSHRRTRRRWDPNVHQRRFWLGSEDRWIRLAVNTQDRHAAGAGAARSSSARPSTRHPPR